MATTRSVYISQTMIDMGAKYEDWGIFGLSEHIAVLDQSHSPKDATSRLSTGLMKKGGTISLAQISPRMMHSLLSNSLVEDVKFGALILNDWNRIPRSVQAAKEPSVYVRFFTSPTGIGLSISEYQEYIQALSDAIQGKTMSTTAFPGFDIVKAVNDYYRSCTDDNEPFLDQVKTFGSANLVDFVKNQSMLIIEAMSTSATEIRFPGEVAWTIHADEHINAQLTKSSLFFRLTVCVVNALWPQKKFELNTFSLFRVHMDQLIEIGESVGSHLLNSYAAYGGCNYSTVPVPVDPALKGIRDQYSDVISFSEATMKATEEEMTEKMKLRQRQLKLIKLSTITQEKNNEIEQLEAELAAAQENLSVKLQRVIENLETACRFLEGDKETKRCIDALVKLHRDLGLGISTPGEDSS